MIAMSILAAAIVATGVFQTVRLIASDNPGRVATRGKTPLI